MRHVGLAVLLLCGCADDPWTPEERDRLLALAARPALVPDPTNALAEDPDAAEFGRALFFEPRLSADGTLSCASCHDPARDFTDGLPLAVGLGTATRHAPTLRGAPHQRWFFWDGRCDSTWCQALGPLENPVEHGSTRLAVVRAVARDPAYASRYEALLGPLPRVPDMPVHARPIPDDPTHPHQVAWAALDPDLRDAIDAAFASVGKLIAAYERQLVHAPAPFDTFIRGVRDRDRDALDALDAEQQRGAALFVRHGCDRCHTGAGFTNGEFHNLGLIEAEPPQERGRFDGIELLRRNPFNGGGPHSDDPVAGARRVDHLVVGPDQLGQHKTPTLRNVARTAPYMHDGSLATLEDVVRFYDELGPEPTWGHREEILVPLALGEGDVAALVALLEALSETPLPEELLGPPAWAGR